MAISNPDRHFLMLTRPYIARIFINPPSNLEVRGVDVDAKGSPRDVIALCNSLLKEFSIDSYADLHDVLRTKLMRIYMRMRGVKVSNINKLRRERKALTRSSNKHLVPLTPVQVLYARVFKELGMHRESHFSSLFGSEGAPVELLSKIPKANLGKPKDRHWIAIAPFARHTGKVYPPDLMEKVIAELTKVKNTYIFLLGAGDEEISQIQRWCDQYPETVNVGALKVGFKAELALMSHCDVILSMDSANMHLASLVNRPVVSIWGATHPYTGFYGRGQSAENAIQLALPCRPCSIYGNKPCRRGDYLCLAGVNPELVVTRLKQVCHIE